MKKHTMVVKDRIGTIDDVWLVQGSYKADELLVKFEDEEWDSLNKLVTFSGSASIITPSKIDKEDGSVSVIVPWEVMREPGRVQVVVDGVDSATDTIVKTAKLLSSMSVRASYLGAQEYDPTISEYKILYDKVYKLADKIDEFATDIIESWKVEGDTMYFLYKGVIVADETLYLNSFGYQ